MNFSDKLLETIRLQKKLIRFDPMNRAGVISNLKFLYHSCYASERLLAEAVDEASGHLHHYYLEHLEEEKGEIGQLVDDLDSAGIATGLPDWISLGMIGSQYYLLKHLSCSCLLGYMMVQEADPTPIKTVEVLEYMYGKDLFRFLRMHAIKDLEHRERLIELVDGMPKRFHDLIWFSADNALSYLTKAGIEFYG